MLDIRSSAAKKNPGSSPLLPYRMLFGSVRVGIFCMSMCLITITAHAQQDAAGNLAPRAAKASSGWWSPSPNETTLDIPLLNASTAKSARFGAAERLPNLAIEDVYAINQSANGWFVSQAGFELTRTQSALAEGQLPSGSFLSVLNDKYVAWETGLSDSRSLTNVSGVLVYPLIEIDYAHWHLPITLYGSPLRGTASR